MQTQWLLLPKTASKPSAVLQTCLTSWNVGHFGQHTFEMQTKDLQSLHILSSAWIEPCSGHNLQSQSRL